MKIKSLNESGSFLINKNINKLVEYFKLCVIININYNLKGFKR